MTTSIFVALDTAGATTGNVLLETEIDASSELLALMDDETGTGALVFGTSPDITTSITTPSTTFALLNTTATTVNAFGATTTLNIGASATTVLNFGGSTTAAEFRFLEPSASGTNYSAFKAVAQGANITYSLPPTVGAAGTYLKDVAGDGVLTWATAGGGAALSGITAATGANTIANGANVDQIWNWAPTVNSKSAITFGETTAATGGTSTAFVPNQILAKFTTLAGSTMSPLAVYSRGAHVFSVSPTTAQIVAATGGTAGAPTYSFADGGGMTSGMYLSGSNEVSISTGSLQRMKIVGSGGIRVTGGTDGGGPVFSDLTNGNTGLTWPATNTMGIANSTDDEWVRFGSRFIQLSRGSTDATAFTINSRKARGTVPSPTVITTGDDLLTVSGYGYVGATNTFQEAASITIDSAGTISDSATGIGGILRFNTATVGAEPTERMTIDNVGNIKIAGTAVRATTEGTNHLDIFDGTAPVGTLANGISIYSTSGEGYMMDAAGNATLQTPHENVNNYWVFDSSNSITGKRLLVDMELMVKKLNETMGWDYVHETINGKPIAPADSTPSTSSEQASSPPATPKLSLDLKLTGLEERIAALETTSGSTAGGLLPSLGSLAVDFFKGGVQSVTDGIAYLKGLVVEKLTTKELCLEDVCINKTQLKELLEKNEIQNSTPAPLVPSEVEGESAPEVTPTPEPAPAPTLDPASTPAPAPIPETSTPTPTPIPNPAPAPEPVPDTTTPPTAPLLDQGGDGGGNSELISEPTPVPEPASAP
ncbi:hypothetical protein HYW72_00535 [Candidatus Nomurabacteria bacterium]|nr:hypothetical protein [Candidatus Nomurabacteria bacterium]